MEAIATAPETAAVGLAIPGPTPKRGLDMDKLARYVELSDRLKAAEDVAAAIKQERAALQDDLMTAFEQGGLSRIGVNGKTVYLHRSINASAAAGQKEALVAALRDAGLEGLITYSPQSLSSYVRELDGAGKTLPENIAPLVSVYEAFSLRVVKGK